MNRDELDNVLNLHHKWRYRSSEGKRADLRGADLGREDLSGADLFEADLSGTCLEFSNLRGVDLAFAHLGGAILSEADLSYAILVRADFERADIFYASLRKANLRGANLRGANLRGADLSYADLSYADLSYADLRGANLIGADLYNACLSYTSINFPIACPDEGSFVGWKKANDKIIKLLIPEDAIRSSATGRKCRCNKAIVLEIQNIDGTASELSSISSTYDKNFIYEIGKTAYEPQFDTNRWNECAPGIHFFITRQEAMNY